MGATTVVPFFNKEMTVTNPSVIHFSVWKKRKNQNKKPSQDWGQGRAFLFLFFFRPLIIFHALLVQPMLNS
jgi:hypothetical protein